MEVAIQKLAIVSLFVIGGSHMIQPRVWSEFFAGLVRMGERGAFVNGFIHFPLGAIIVAFHNVWEGIPLMLTLIGYGWVLKGFIAFSFPRLSLLAMSRVSVERSWEFIPAGFVATLIAALLLFDLAGK